MTAPDFYRITPRVVGAGETVEIAISGNYPHTDLRTLSGPLTVEAVGGDGLFRNGDLPGFTCGNGFDLGRPPREPVADTTADGAGVLRFRYDFRCEGECSFRLRQGERVLTEFSIYALRKEWLDLRPFRGDLHLHSGYSCCNRDPERLSPEYYAAANCARGLDFICISDHKQYFPSRKAEDFARQCGGDFRVYPSEEIHLPDLHNIHELNFGGDRPVSSQLHRGIAAYDRDLAAFLKRVPAWNDEYCRYMAANFHIIYERVHEADGLVVFCHPFWRPRKWLFLPRPVREYVLEHRLYDALELYGDGQQNCDETEAMYFEQCMKEGRRIPAVGNTDAHELENLAKNSTVIFARSNEFPELRKSLLANLNVAVNGLTGDFPRTSGPLELVSFYHFLRMNYYPRHDALNARAGEAMFQTLAAGEPDPRYGEFIHQPYPKHVDGDPKAWTRNRFAPTPLMADVQKEKTALEQEFWGEQSRV